MKRAKEKMQPVCCWCKREITLDLPYRTVIDGLFWRICAPDCDQKPEDAKTGVMP